MRLSEALKIAQSPTPAGAERLRVYLACGFTPLHLTTFLKAHLIERSRQRAVEIETGIYGDLPGNLERLREADCDVGAVVIEWSDFDPRLGLRTLGGWGPKASADIRENVQSSASRFLRLLEAAARSKPLAVCLPTLPLPPLSHLPSAQAGADELALRVSAQDFALKAAAVPGVRLLSQQRLDESSPPAARHDVKSELTTGFPYRLEHASRVAELLAQLIEPRRPKKGLITDLDDTLWRGILGEDGVAGLSWELDRRTHVHALYQQLLAALAESGVLVGVASKNDHALALEALGREDLLVRKEQLFPLEVNWGQKSRSVEKILRAWNISADAVVFVDDSPLELAEAKALHPDLECLLFPKDDEQAAYQFLVRLRDLFGKQELFEEDAIRAASLRRAAEFESGAASEPSGSLEDFLARVEAEITFAPVDAETEARAFELINKTNQFNINGARLSESEFRAALGRPGAVSLVVSYKDKFGPLGKIAVLLGRAEDAAVRVDTWVMSCRAFSRHIEFRCIEYLFENWGARHIEVAYRPTARNGPARDFLARFIDAEPDADCRIRREIFMSRKPALFQQVKSLSHVRHTGTVD